MHGDVGRTIPVGAGHETPTPAELVVSNSNAGHGEANANARREVACGHHGQPRRTRDESHARNPRERQRVRHPPRIKELASDTSPIAGGI